MEKKLKTVVAIFWAPQSICVFKESIKSPAERTSILPLICRFSIKSNYYYFNFYNSGGVFVKKEE